MSTVLVTGGNRGIGLGLVKEFLKKNDVKTVIATARNPSSSKDLLAISDSRLHIVELDVASDASIVAAVEKVSAIVGSAGLEILVNNSGILNSYPVDGPIDRKALTEHFDINTIGPLVVFQAFLPLLRKAAASAGNAKVLNISSAHASIQQYLGLNDRHYIAYKMSKTALNQQTKALSIDFAKENILVYAFCPGWVQTDMGTSAAPLTVDQSAKSLLSTFSQLKKEHSGGYFNHEFQPIPY